MQLECVHRQSHNMQGMSVARRLEPFARKTSSIAPRKLWRHDLVFTCYDEHWSAEIEGE